MEYEWNMNGTLVPATMSSNVAIARTSPNEMEVSKCFYVLKLGLHPIVSPTVTNLAIVWQHFVVIQSHSAIEWACYIYIYIT